jgi:hypothetical protein
MIFEHSSKNKKVLFIASLIILLLGVFIIFYSSVIFQEGNPWPQIKGIIQLKFSGADIVQLSGSDNKFMTESKNGMIIHNLMKTKGYEFTEQMGSGYFFKSPTGQSAVATHRYYTRHYSLWTITMNTNLENDQTEKVKDSDLIMDAIRKESDVSPELLVDSCVSSIMQETEDLIMVYIRWTCSDIGGGARAILKKQGDNYRFIAMLQDWPSCELMKEFSVPKSFYEACY